MEATESQIPKTATGTSRRVLLKGAVAAGVGAAVYASPIVSSVPAYATHGLSTWTVESGDICLGFSPNHEGDYGDWHIPDSVTDIFSSRHDFNGTVFSGINHAGDGPQNRSDKDIRVWVKVGATWRQVGVSGHFNNWGGASDTGNFGVVGWNGGGIRMRLFDPNCEMKIQGFFQGTDNDATNCTITANGVMKSSFSPIDNGGVNPGTAPLDNVPNPWQGDATRIIYYHSGQPRKGGNWLSGVRFRIRCRN